MDTAKPGTIPTGDHSSSIMQIDRKGAIPINDPIDNFVLGLLENQQSTEANQPQGVSEKAPNVSIVESAPPEVYQAPRTQECDNCKSYLPLLKSFILHLDSSHKSAKANGINEFQCELCYITFNDSLELGKHYLLHACGRDVTNEMQIGASNGPSVTRHEASHKTKQVAAKQHERQPRKRGRPRKAQLDELENNAPRKIVTRRRGRPRKQEKENQATEVTLEEGDVVSCDPDQGESDHNVSNDVDNPPSHDMQPTEQEMVAKDAKGKCFVRPRDECKPAEEVITNIIPNAVVLQNNESQYSKMVASMKEPISTDSSPTALVESVPVNDKNIGVGEGPVLVTDDHSMEGAEYLESNGGCAKRTRTDSTAKMQAKIGDRKKRNIHNQCVVCLNKFPSKDALRLHRYTHGDKDKWPCPDCGKVFSSHWKYHDHCAKVHNNKKPFQCDECGKFLSSFTILATHKGVHSGARPHQCNLCGKRYLVAAGLRDHLIAHKNEREHRCSHCGAAFNAKGDLKKHMVTHMAEKPHNCEICHTGFNRSASLRRHMRSHTGEKPFKCDICNKAFSRKEKMHEHRRTHTGERPHVCNECGKSFKDSSNFSNHKKIHLAGYIPRKRKRTASTKVVHINSVVIPADKPEISITQPSVTDIAEASTVTMLPQPPVINVVPGKENPLKDFATISTTIEDLQSAGQEWIRQLLGSSFDSNDFRNLVSAQAAATAPSNLINLSPVDVRSLQLIINGVQARNASGAGGSASQSTENST